MALTRKRVAMIWMCGWLLLTQQIVGAEPLTASDLWKMTETPYGRVMAGGDREPGKLTSISGIRDGHIYSVRYLQYAFAADEYNAFLSCKKLPVSKCDPKIHETALLFGDDSRQGAAHFYWEVGLSYIVTKRINDKRIGMPLEAGWYRVIGRYFAVGPIVFADINQGQVFAGVVLALHYGLLHRR